MKRLLTTATVAAGAMFFQLPAYATPGGSIKDTWAIGSTTGDKPTNITGTLPTLTLSKTTTSNDGQITPVTDPDTQTGLTVGTTTSIWAFVAIPQGSGLNEADIPINITLSDGGTGTKTFTVWMDYYANFSTDKDSMSWSTSPIAPGWTTTGSFSVNETLSDGEIVTFGVPYETDWDMAQAFTVTVEAPEPYSIALLGFGLLGPLAVAKRKRS